MESLGYSINVAAFADACVFFTVYDPSVAVRIIRNDCWPHVAFSNMPFRVFPYSI
jgi:hypothetical protein